MENVQELYSPTVIAANSTNAITSHNVGGFLCSVSGTITLATNETSDKPATTLFSDLPVTAGVYYPLPFYLGRNGGTFTTAGDAAGVLGT